MLGSFYLHQNARGCAYLLVDLVRSDLTIDEQHRPVSLPVALRTAWKYHLDRREHHDRKLREDHLSSSPTEYRPNHSQVLSDRRKELHERRCCSNQVGLESAVDLLVQSSRVVFNSQSWSCHYSKLRRGTRWPTFVRCPIRQRSLSTQHRSDQRTSVTGSWTISGRTLSRYQTSGELDKVKRVGWEWPWSDFRSIYPRRSSKRTSWIRCGCMVHVCLL